MKACKTIKKTLIVCSVFLLFAVTTLAQTPTYKELSATAYNLIKGQDYIGAHKAFHTLDSLYGISNFEALYYYYSLSHDFVPDREAEKTLMFRLAQNKCCDMRYLDDWARSQQADTLDYWNDIVAIVLFSPFARRLQRQYSLNLHIESDTLRVSGFYLIPYDTTTYSGQPIKVDTAYSLPLADYRTADGAIVLRREGNWYPHINGELLTAQVHIKADDYYIIGGTEWLPSFDIHLVLLPKDKYACKVIDSPIRPFHFYRLASDTTQYPEAYYREFVDSYNFYCSFFGRYPQRRVAGRVHCHLPCRTLPTLPHEHVDCQHRSAATLQQTQIHNSRSGYLPARMSKLAPLVILNPRRRPAKANMDLEFLNSKTISCAIQLHGNI